MQKLFNQLGEFCLRWWQKHCFQVQHSREINRSGLFHKPVDSMHVRLYYKLQSKLFLMGELCFPSLVDLSLRSICKHGNIYLSIYLSIYIYIYIYIYMCVCKIKYFESEIARRDVNFLVKILAFRRVWKPNYDLDLNRLICNFKYKETEWNKAHYVKISNPSFEILTPYTKAWKYVSICDIKQFTCCKMNKWLWQWWLKCIVLKNHTVKESLSLSLSLSLS